jgi:diaminopimelate decarboxylase
MYKELANKYGTPLYLYDFNQIEKQFIELKEAFKARKSLVCYAVKANSNLSVLKHLKELGAGCDCVSIGEVKRALHVGVAKYKIIFSGVGKRDDEIKEALRSDILMINIESEEEMNRVEVISQELGLKARISIRVNPNIDPKTHPYISTGLHESKFGVEIDLAKRLYLRAKESEYLNPIGIHFHIGSQITDLSTFEEASKIVADLARSLISLKIDIRFFNIGGGVGIKYIDEKQIELYDYAQAIYKNLHGLDITLVCEPGRILVGNSGIFLTKVLYEKHNSGKRFIVVDGGMNDLLRPSLYQASHKMEVLGSEDKEKSLCDVVGPVCESGDFFAKNTLMPRVKSGDLIGIEGAGAYCFSMSSNYNTREKVAEVALVDGEARLIRKRDSFEDMIKNESECIS